MSSAVDPARFGPPIRLGGLRAEPVTDASALAAVLALRARVFRGDREACDRDPQDAACLHLQIRADRGGPLATARLQPHPDGRITGGYAARFYDLSALAAAPGRALEIGRLCLDPDHASPDLMRLLWAGVARAAGRWDAARLIGCTSFPGTDPDPLAPALAMLARRHLGPADLRPGRRAEETRLLSDWAETAAPADVALTPPLLPPLLRAYLALGGWVSDHLVIDRDLGSCHIFTCVEIASMPEGRKRLLRALAGD